MKLTNYIRDAFVRAVMNDVPQIDYVEQIRAAALKACVDALPPKVKAAWNDAACRQYVATESIHLSTVYTTVHVPAVDRDSARKIADEACKVLVNKSEEQRKRISALHDKVKAVAYGMSTRKALAEALPEFEKYLPVDEAKAIRSLPVVANVVAEFVRAGWPKDAKKAA